MKLYGLVGYPCKHSLSPAVHNAGFKELGLDAKYEIFETRDLAEVMDRVASGEISGLSVTMPYKKEVIPYLKEVDESVEKIGACNCVNGSHGYNTDADGAFAALSESCDVKGKKIYLLGAGGAGAAIAYALYKNGADTTIFNIDLEPAKELSDKYAFEAKLLKDLDSNFDILINATSCGFRTDESCVPKEFFNPDQTIMDIVYAPLETRLIRDAEEAGCNTVTGEKMLLQQAFTAFEIWTGKKAPKEAMRKALYSFLKKSAPS